MSRREIFKRYQILTPEIAKGQCHLVVKQLLRAFLDNGYVASVLAVKVLTRDGGSNHVILYSGSRFYDPTNMQYSGRIKFSDSYLVQGVYNSEPKYVHYVERDVTRHFL